MTDPRAWFIGSPPHDWEGLAGIGQVGLREMGCRAWDDPDDDGMVLMLFPGEWYRHIPTGFEIVDINGIAEPFEPGQTDGDSRYGCLAYGVRTKAAEGTKV